MKTSIIICLFAASVCSAIEVFVQNVSVAIGEDAVIPCNYETEDDFANFSDSDVVPTITWHAVDAEGGDSRIGGVKPDKTLFDDAGFAGKRSGVYVDEEGSLKIPSTTFEDNNLLGNLRCEVEFGDLGVLSKNLKFLVYSLPKEAPTAKVNKKEFDIQQDFNTNIGACFSSASYPASQIIFFKNGKSLEKPGGDVLDIFYDTSNFEKTEDGWTETTEKDLMMQLDSSDDMAVFVCNVKTTVFDKVVYEKNVTMDTFRVFYTTTKVSFVEKPTAYLGEDITLKCIADGYPNATIMINDDEMSTKTFEVTEDMDGNEYHCSAYNSNPDDAVVSDTYTMEVLSISEPKIEGASDDNKMEVMLGEDIEITGTAEGNPTPTLAWYKGDNKVSDSEVLKIPKSKFEHSATYTLRAVNGHDILKKSSDVMVDVKGMVLEGEKEEMLEGKKDATLTLECTVSANPEPTFKWSDEEATSSELKTGYTYTSQITVGPLTTKLSKKEYTCTATTPDGVVVTKKFTLPEISEASNATAGIIIAILVVLLIVAIILAVLYNKGIICKKQEKGEESADGDIAVEINNDEDVEAGNGKAAAETEPLVEGNEDEKMLNGENSNE